MCAPSVKGMNMIKLFAALTFVMILAGCSMTLPVRGQFASGGGNRSCRQFGYVCRIKFIICYCSMLYGKWVAFFTATGVAVNSVMFAVLNL